jgi:hypothetical protein
MGRGQLRILLIAALVATSSLSRFAAATPLRTDVGEPRPVASGWVLEEWEWLKTLLFGDGSAGENRATRGLGTPSALRPEAGCGIDPNGQPLCTTGISTLRPKAGCGSDPNGKPPCNPGASVLRPVGLTRAVRPRS